MQSNESSNSDLVFITETWLHPTGDEVTLTSLMPPRYVASSFPRLTKPHGYGGICVLVKTNLVNPRSTRLLFSSFECSKTEININNTLVRFFCIYRPPPSQENCLTPMMFIDEFESFIDDNVSTNVRTVIIGDINFHYDIKNDTYTHRMCELLSIRNLFQLCDRPTHVKVIFWIG